MELLSPSEFSLQLLRPLSEDAMPQSEIVVRGRPTGQLVNGAILEAAIKWGTLYLAFVTDDIPQEDTLRIYLFDSQVTLIDSAALGAMYSTGSFTGLQLSPPNHVRFQFIGDIVWTLELLNSKVFSLPFGADPKGVSRPFKLHRRFKIYGEPKPGTS